MIVNQYPQILTFHNGESVLGYSDSDSVFGVAADIVCSAENSSTADPKKAFEDLVIALSLNTDLPRKEARIRLAAMLPNDYNEPHWTPARDGLCCSIADFKPWRSR